MQFLSRRARRGRRPLPSLRANEEVDRTSPAVVDYFIAHRLEVAAGVKQQLEMDAKRIPGLRH